MKLFNKFFKIILPYLRIHNIIIFESHTDFSDNTKILFDYLLEHNFNQKYKFVWFVENPDKFKHIIIPNVSFIQLYPQKFIPYCQMFYYLYRAKYGFFSHRLPKVKPNHGETFINLWHGSGLKKTTHVDMSHNVDYIHCNSDFFKNLRIKNYGYKKNMLNCLGNPRNDLLFSGDRNHILEALYGKTYTKCIIWMPTFRKKKNGVLEFSDQDNFTFLKFCNNYSEDLDEILISYDTLLIIKPHPMENYKIIMASNISNIQILTNSNLADRQIELYTLLGNSDALVTDVSSVYIDYLLLNKPIGFVIDGLDNYQYGYHVENPLDYMPGNLIKDYQDFKNFIEDIIHERDSYIQKRKEINNLLNEYKRDFSERIVKHYSL
jgi:CDP-glycerol glycerophosphotransferase (TagB/SpsB family)